MKVRVECGRDMECEHGEMSSHPLVESGNGDGVVAECFPAELVQVTEWELEGLEADDWDRVEVEVVA